MALVLPWRGGYTFCMRTGLFNQVAGMLLAVASAGLLPGCPTEKPQAGGESSPTTRRATEPICLPDEIIACLVEVSQIQYVPDQKGRDSWQTPSETARLGQGDCEDLAIYFQDLMRRKGYAVDVVFGLEHRWADHGHCWCEMDLDDGRYVIEPRYAMFLPRKDLPKVMYIVAEDIDVVADKVRAYHRRTGVCVSEGYRSAVVER